MEIEILRLSHRLPRDSRTTTHVALTARAFGAVKIYYSGQKDSEMEEGIKRVKDNFGGEFQIQHIEKEMKLINEKKKEGFKIAHLTMYGEKLEEKIKEIKTFKKLLIIVGGEKVEGKFYEAADINLSVSNQPISEVSALGIVLYEVNGIADIKNGKIRVLPNKKGKTVIKNQN